MIRAIKIQPKEMSGKVFKSPYGRTQSYHLPYYFRTKSTFFNKRPINQRTLIHIFQTLHHNADHGIPAIAARWKPACRRFERHHLAASGNGSCRFLNTYTAHQWM